jgi:hypothetical protein
VINDRPFIPDKPEAPYLMMWQLRFRCEVWLLPMDGKASAGWCKRFVPFMFRISEQGTVPRLTSDQSTGSQTSGFIQHRRESDPFKKFQHSDLQSALLYQLGTNRKLQHGGEDW